MIARPPASVEPERETVKQGRSDSSIWIAWRRPRQYHTQPLHLPLLEPVNENRHFGALSPFGTFIGSIVFKERGLELRPHETVDLGPAVVAVLHLAEQWGMVISGPDCILDAFVAGARTDAF
jgi:hypothetical protein